MSSQLEDQIHDRFKIAELTAQILSAKATSSTALGGSLNDLFRTLYKEIEALVLGNK